MRRVVFCFWALLASCATGSGEMDGVRFTSPEPTSGVLSGVVELEVEAIGAFEGDIELFMDSELIFAWTAAPILRHRLTTNDIPDGAHLFEVRAMQAGQIVVDTLSLRFENHGPIVTLTAPIASDQFVEDGPFRITAEVEESGPLVEVLFFVHDDDDPSDDEPIRSFPSPLSRTFEVEFDPAGLEREIEIVVRATDARGNSGEAFLRVIIAHRELYSTFVEGGFVEFGPLALSHGRVVVGSTNNLSILTADGAVECTFGMGTNTNAPLIASTSAGTIGWSTDRVLYLLSIADCSQVAMLDTGTTSVFGMVEQDGIAAAVTFGGVLRFINMVDGMVLSEIDLAALVPMHVLDFGHALAFTPDGTLFVAAKQDDVQGALFVVDAMDRTMVVAYPGLSSAFVGGAAADETTVFLPARDGRIYRYGIDGILAWEGPVTLSEGAPLRSTPVLAAGVGGAASMLIVGDGEAEVFALDPATGGALWSTVIDPRNLPGTIGRGGVAISSTRRRIAIGDTLGRVTVLNRITGDILAQTFLTMMSAVPLVVRLPVVSDFQVTAINQEARLVAYRLTVDDD